MGMMRMDPKSCKFLRVPVLAISRLAAASATSKGVE